jgi:hypothetical protein
LVIPNGAVVAVDRFFTSVPLFLDLKKRGIDGVGSMLPSRKGFPVGLLESKTMERGDVKFASTGQLLAINWLDKKPLYMLSTCF